MHTYTHIRTVARQMRTYTHTHTVATLEVSPRTYDEIAAALNAAGYHFVVEGAVGGVIDMSRIGLVRGATESGNDPMWTRAQLLLVGACRPDHDARWAYDANELLAIVRVWTREQRIVAEDWVASALFDDSAPMPNHVRRLEARPS